MDADKILTDVRGLKTRATALRNRGNPEGGLEPLADAVRLLEPAVAAAATKPDPDARLSELRKELADAYGMMGGLERRRNRLAEALALYRKGSELEALDPGSSYNLGNAIVLSITVERQDPGTSPLKEQIAALMQILQPRVQGRNAVRADEWWAWSDLGQAYLLSGQVDRAAKAYERGLESGPAAGDIKRSAALLGELATALPATAAHLAGPIRAQVERLASPG